MDFTKIPLIGKRIAKEQVFQAGRNLKKEFLGRWSIEQLRVLCKDKGIEMTRMDVRDVTIDNPKPVMELSYRELIDAVVQLVPGNELIWYCEQHGIKCDEFKSGFGVLVSELNKI